MNNNKALNRIVCRLWAAFGLGALALQAAAAPVVYLAGDSTVMSYGSGNAPQQGWGGRLSALFGAGVSFSNRAIGGRSSKSFVDEGRLAAIVTAIRPGDYLFVQFGHNDDYSDPRLHTDPFTTYKTYLGKYVDQARGAGAVPVLVTPMARRHIDGAGRFINDFVDRVSAIRQLAAEKQVALIDLNDKSLAFYRQIGVAATTDVFLWLAPGAYAKFPNGVHDITHFQEYGAAQLARFVSEGIEENRLGIRSLIGAVAYPAEAGLLAGAGTVRERAYAGWQGSGYVNFPRSGGSLTMSNVNGKSGGMRTLRIRFANGSASARSGQLVVNGSTSNISFRPSGGWTTWVTQDVPVALVSGTGNAISLKSTGADLANVDTLTVL
ncbi:GDSL-type esterase/lipase family protein [Massilia sp. CF038]|uniref:GDSL-type esterase/lipase family protein n=1 Tax=Massilia sp. CF038 TaxID=1881045 RepID=UPI000921AD6D|nr:GDSL-type esterase/lipase family protein [Massilia sp. CF038]SHG63048.1 Lysophospholipase L1 [Massilia sp. CF038]